MPMMQHCMMQEEAIDAYLSVLKSSLNDVFRVCVRPDGSGSQFMAGYQILKYAADSWEQQQKIHCWGGMLALGHLFDEKYFSLPGVGGTNLKDGKEAILHTWTALVRSAANGATDEQLQKIIKAALDNGCNASFFIIEHEKDTHVTGLSKTGRVRLEGLLDTNK
mmetsp:Transcript_8204/g.10377  ORF Transcript_8204/g.10377 Transcript_8204/m.10377 type:complete len:164 (+) Transcript_8204:615-1106(+)